MKLACSLTVKQFQAKRLRLQQTEKTSASFIRTCAVSACAKTRTTASCAFAIVAIPWTKLKEIAPISTSVKSGELSHQASCLSTMYCWRVDNVSCLVV